MAKRMLFVAPTKTAHSQFSLPLCFTVASKSKDSDSSSSQNHHPRSAEDLKVMLSGIHYLKILVLDCDLLDTQSWFVSIFTIYLYWLISKSVVLFIFFSARFHQRQLLLDIQVINMLQTARYHLLQVNDTCIYNMVVFQGSRDIYL